MQTHLRAVVFDVGNVLLDWNPAYLYDKLIPDREERAWFLTHVLTPGWHAEQDRGRSCAAGVAALSERFPGSSALIAAFYERWLETISGPIEGTVEILTDLKRNGVAVHALTNFSAELWQTTCAAYPFLGDFDQAVVSGEVGFIKPDPRIFDVLCARTGLAPADMLFIDDREDNVEAARQLGFRTIRFTGPDALAGELSALGFPVRQPRPAAVPA
ncbi:2-haloacid dehalogenase [Tepidamorphus gemmatus]|uniref:2-haloacid dehalogenase n=1 Tax=Tepidamorphus gemmatus TaxID=747076 RepID=A0A4V2UZK4_9HYPH|nr:HAD family phosphatase [Tepidamorphus gemmatus]TCT11738.1 2-haloacid dehalogenase [Tepidamorphus gemmatus]